MTNPLKIVLLCAALVAAVAIVLIRSEKARRPTIRPTEGAYRVTMDAKLAAPAAASVKQ